MISCFACFIFACQYQAAMQLTGRSDRTLCLPRTTDEASVCVAMAQARVAMHISDLYGNGMLTLCVRQWVVHSCLDETFVLTELRHCSRVTQIMLHNEI